MLNSEAETLRTPKRRYEAGALFCAGRLRNRHCKAARISTAGRVLCYKTNEAGHKPTLRSCTAQKGSEFVPQEGCKLGLALLRPGPLCMARRQGERGRERVEASRASEVHGTNNQRFSPAHDRRIFAVHWPLGQCCRHCFLPIVEGWPPVFLFPIAARTMWLSLNCMPVLATEARQTMRWAFSV